MQNTLFLHEEIMLLALRDEEGTIASRTMYQYAIGAALLAELLLSKRIVNGEITGKAATEAIQAMQAAVMVAVIMPTLIATTASH